ncbi:hypothetical protein QYQ99_15450 [Comamonas testosteroni]|uniref:hypothetical protein n=1 Tax=Comamonas TaxID=283 RepID=UPI00265ECE9A|nr:hypothetical protein [Comamonas testosteroni]WKL13826.1 hypothetical protein QYQ99_15450 [Comamonas testosteroni]
MTKFFFGAVFFLSFYRISVFYSFAYISIFINFAYLLFVFSSVSKANKLIFCAKFEYILILLLFFYSLVIDILYGADFDSMSLSLRIFFMFFASIFSAFFIVEEYIKNDVKKLLWVLKLSFFVQLFFWIATYISVDFKVAVYNFIGASDSVNLWPQNIESRGFGLSNEINFTSPSVSVFISLILIGLSSPIVLINAVTQLVNSNLVAVAAILGFMGAKIKVINKIIFAIVSFVLIFYFGIKYIPRFSDEIDSGGLRTVQILIENHLNFHNNGFWDWMFGAGTKVYGEESGSDIGWVILINYYGVISIFLVLFLLIALSMRAFKNRIHQFLWLTFGLILNTKGLVIGANAYIFMTFVFIFIRSNHEMKGDSHEIR